MKILLLLAGALAVSPLAGQEIAWLPVPAVFLIGRDGTIKFVYANPDYKIRLKAAVLLAAARAALEN